MSQRTRNPRRLINRPRTILTRWIAPPAVPDGQQPIRPGCWWGCVGATVAVVALVALLLAWIA